MESDDRIVEISNLPRVKARAGFTTRVIDRLEKPSAPQHTRLAIAFAGSLIVAVLALEGHRVSLDRRVDAEHDLMELRRELAQIEKNLQAAPDEVVLIGGNEDVDYVLDLREGQPHATLPLVESTYY